MKHPVTIGVIMLARNTFDFEAARGLYADIKKNLAAIPDATFVCADDLVFEVPDLDEPIDKINKANVDGIAIISGTFHLGHLALEIAKRTNAPLLLWGLPELPYNGGKIRLNSVCGVNLNASNLYKAGRDDFHYCVSNDIDMDWVDAVRIRAKLKNAKIGILGFRAHGFFNLAFDELTLYKEIGVLIDHYELTDIWNQPVDDAAVEARKKQIAGIFDLSGVSGEQVQKVAELCERFKAFMDRQGLAGLAVRCWPEFAAGYGVSPCAAMSILQSEGYVIGCEGDVQGVVSQLMHTAMGVEQPFLADLSQVNFDTDSALMWHCGVAALRPCGTVLRPVPRFLLCGRPRRHCGLCSQERQGQRPAHGFRPGQIPPLHRVRRRDLGSEGAQGHLREGGLRQAHEGCPRHRGAQRHRPSRVPGLW